MENNTPGSNSIDQDNTEKNSIQKLHAYTGSNLLTVFWMLILASGSIVFISYYASISYMPDFDLSSSVMFIAASAITALIAFIVLSGLFIAPGVIWSTMWAENELYKEFLEDERNARKINAVIRWFGIPVLFYLIAGVIALYETGYLVFWAIAYIVAIFIFHKPVLRKYDLKVIQSLFFLNFWALVSTLFIILILFSIDSVYSNTPINGEIEGAGYYIIFFGTLSVVAVVNLVVAATPARPENIKYFLVYAFAVVFVILNLSGQWSAVPKYAITIYKLGNIKTDRIILNSKSCSTLESLGVGCEESFSDQCILSNALILSRLGKEFYVEKNGIRFVLNKSDVESWSVKN